jgi:hypothetical protein
VRSQELVALTEIDLLGLGHLSDIAKEEMLAAVDEPIDLGGTCAGLVRSGPETGAMILTLLSRIAASDGSVSPGEREVFGTIARGLEVPDRTRRTSSTPRSRPHRGTRHHSRRHLTDRRPHRRRARGAAASVPAARIEKGASREQLEAAYLAAVERYDPTKMLPFGSDFVRLSVRKLAEITEAFEKACAAA